MKLLVCIAAHYAPERIKYLERVLEELKTYQCEVSIIIDSNAEIPNHTSFVHKDLQHPFHLTQMHRQHFKDYITNFSFDQTEYDWFMYIEDDMLLPWENFLSYTEKLPKLWPGYVPSFIRIEEKDGGQYISDVTDRQQANFIWIDNRPFIALPFPQHYHAFWIAPQWVLKQTINEDFTKLHDSRERSASYLMWELHKKGLLEVENRDGKFQIKEDCYSWHLPNNYIDSDMKNGKIKVKEIFI